MANSPEEEEDDYLNMTFEEPSSGKKETSLQRTARLKKEAAERGRVQSKAEKEAAAQEAREKALATSLDASANKGARLMAKMGFQPGQALGATGNEGRVNPVELSIKDDRGGIGMDSEKKRKVREAGEAAEEGVKRTKLTEEDFRVRSMREREEKRAEGMWWGAMKVLEGLEEDAVKKESGKREEVGELAGSGGKLKPKAMRDIALLYRPLVKNRLEKERERRARYDLMQSLSRNQEYTNEDADDKIALGNEVEELDDEDLELDDYEALPAVERLEKVVSQLREKHSYCFWCKYKYEDQDMEGCPGLTEDEHG